MFFKDLDELPEVTIVRELQRRHALKSQGLCCYCSRKWYSEPVCKFPERHNCLVRGQDGPWITTNLSDDHIEKDSSIMLV